MPKPTRSFTGTTGIKSTGTASAEQLSADLDKAFAMFDPDGLLPDGSPGGIGAENVKQVATAADLPTTGLTNPAWRIVKDPVGDGSGSPTLYFWDGGTWTAAANSVANYGSATTSVATIAGLRARAGGGGPVYVQGYYVAGDGGGGLFREDPGDNATADDGGMVIVSADGTRFKRDFLGSVNAKWFGAKFDYDTGTKTGTDDTTALQASIDYIQTAGGGVVQMPLGYARITAVLVLTADNVQLRGSGRAVTGGSVPVLVWDVDDASIHGINVDNGAGALSGIVIEGLELRGPRWATPAASSGKGIYSYSSHVAVRHCTVRYWGDHGIYLRNGWWSRLQDNSITHNAGWGVYLDGQSNVVKVRGGECSYNGQGGMRLYGSDEVGGDTWGASFIGCSIENNDGPGLRIDGSRGTVVESCYIENNGEANSTPYQIQTAQSADNKIPSALSIIGGLLNGSAISGAIGILLTDVAGITITRPAIIRCDTGIRTQTGASGVKIDSPFYETVTTNLTKDAGAGTIGLYDDSTATWGTV